MCESGVLSIQRHGSKSLRYRKSTVFWVISPQVLAFFDSAAFREMLKECCPAVATLTAEELLQRYRAEAEVAELAHVTRWMGWDLLERRIVFHRDHTDSCRAKHHQHPLYHFSFSLSKCDERSWKKCDSKALPAETIPGTVFSDVTTKEARSAKQLEGIETSSPLQVETVDLVDG